jgi:putative DNA primase/helicase
MDSINFKSKARNTNKTQYLQQDKNHPTPTTAEVPQQPTQEGKKTPTYQAPIFENIPPRLKTGRHHVVWKPEPRKDDKIGKTPYIARAFLANGNLYRASSTKATSWSTYKQAHHAYQSGQFAGIGCVLCNDITLVDIDHCINQTGEIHPAAQEIIDLLDTYTERSPSGDGFHLFPAGAIPETAKNRYSYKGIEIEIYSTGRYSTLTGDRIPGTPQDVQDRQATILTLIERLEQWERENTSGAGVCGEGASDNQAQASTPTLQQGAPQSSRAGTARQVPALPHSQTDQAQTSTPLQEQDFPPGDQEILARARAARNGQNFMQLWSGGDPRGRNDKSKADFDLVLQLLYWTNDNASQTERLYRASGRYDEKTDRKTTRSGRSYLQMTIYNALRKRHQVRAPRHQKRDPEPPTTPSPERPSTGQRGPARQDLRLPHAHHWTRANETEEERQQKLQDLARRVAEQIEQHIRSGQNGLLVANVAPGVGKSTTVAPLGERTTSTQDNKLNLAWIAERRNMIAQVEALKYYRHIEPCTHQNCPDGHHLHNQLGERGYNAWSVHKLHGLGCHYAQQFKQTGSAVYQLAHVATKYPTQHEGIIIDELDITKWLPEREMNIGRLSAAARVYPTDSTADLLLRCITATITDASQAKQPLHGLDLFHALNRRAGGQLANWIAELNQDNRYTNRHPWYKITEEDPAAQELEAATVAPVVLPHILAALTSEVVKWQHSQQTNQTWNSCIRIGPSTQGWAIYLTERRTFTPGEDGLPARAILDATADQEILSRLFREQIQLVQADIEPPPATRHLAIRTGKRYGKTSLTAKRKDGQPNRDLERAIAEARYILRELDPDGSAQAQQKIGLISFQGCIDQLGETLGIPQERRLHFWAARGSNALQDCRLLLVIGTPCVNPATVARLARALWADDPEPISTESQEDDQGRRRYVDPRMQRLSDHLTRAELTQCAHRSRALRAARTVVTFCLGEIDYLPATKTITELPALTPDGHEVWKVRREAEQQRLDQARQRLEEEGRTVALLTVRELKAEARVSTDTAASYLRQARKRAPRESQEDTHTAPHLCSHSVPESPSRSYIGDPGTKSPEKGPPAEETERVAAETYPKKEPVTFLPRRGTETTPPEYHRPCIRCGHVDEWIQIPCGEGKMWVCSCYEWWYAHPERRRQV